MQNTTSGAGVPVPFSFESHTVRTVNRHGDCWFVANDVCGVLDLKNPRSSLALLDDDEKGVHTVDTPGGQQEMSIINESGLYALILRSRKPEARRFRKWVTNEVLPAIRKSGGYIHEAAMKPQLTEHQINSIRKEFRCLEYGHNPAFPYITNHLRVIFSVAHWHHIPSEYSETVRAIIKSKEEAVSQFKETMVELRKWFQNEVLMGGTPWTPAIKRKMTQKLKRQVILPPKVDWLALAEQVKKPVKGKTEQSAP